jgi:Calx-beta domain
VNANFTVTLSVPSAQSVSVGYTTEDGSAHAPDDYFPGGGSLVFSPGQTTKTATVQVRGDLLDELDENYFLNPSGPVNATIAGGQGIGTIRNDDAPPPPPPPPPPPLHLHLFHLHQHRRHHPRRRPNVRPSTNLRRGRA